jgi:glutathione S-transferase
MSDYRLHGFCQSGNTFKVAFLLRALDQPFETVFVDYLGSGENRQGDWRERVNAMGEAPVLETGGRRLTQSAAILGWLADRHGRFGGAGEEERFEVQRWLFFDNHKFTSYFATYRFMKAFNPAQPDAAVMAFLRGRVEAAFGIVEKHLAGRDFVVGAEPTIADFSMTGYLFYPAGESGIDLAAQFPNIGAWVGRMRQVPGWADPYDVLPGECVLPLR